MDSGTELARRGQVIRGDGCPYQVHGDPGIRLDVPDIGCIAECSEKLSFQVLNEVLIVPGIEARIGGIGGTTVEFLHCLVPRTALRRFGRLVAGAGRDENGLDAQLKESPVAIDEEGFGRFL